MPDETGSGRSWFASLRALIPGQREESLRDRIEEAIDGAETGGERESVGDLSSGERQMVRNLLHFGERTVGDVAVPRSDIIAIPDTTTFDELVSAFAEAGHSRLPVYAESLDHVIGMIHIKDAFAILATGGKPPATIRELIREPRYVPQSMGVLDLLAEMQSTRTHLAIVLDEYSGTDGLVTIEDLVEEIVGEIEDEHDDAPTIMLSPVDDGMWEADARTNLEDVAREIDARLGETDEDIDTIGGLATILAGHVPQAGEVFDHPSGWRIEVTEGDARRASRLRLHPPRATLLAEPQDQD